MTFFLIQWIIDFIIIVILLLIFIVIIQHSHACKNNCDVFFGRTEELERMKNYVVRVKDYALYEVLTLTAVGGYFTLRSVVDKRTTKP